MKKLFISMFANQTSQFASSQPAQIADKHVIKDDDFFGASYHSALGMPHFGIEVEELSFEDYLRVMNHQPVSLTS